MALIPIDEYIAKEREKVNALFPNPQVRPGPASPTEQPGFLSGPFERGMKGVAADMTNVAGMAAQAAGFDEVSQGLYDKAQEFADARDQIPRRVPRMEDIQDLGDLGTFAVETLVENAPLLASIALPGGIAAKVAGLAGASLRGAEVAGAVSGFLVDAGLQTGESAEIARQNGQSPLDYRVVGTGIGKGVLDFVPMLTVAKRIGLLKAVPLGPLIEGSIAKTLTEGGFFARVAGEMGTIAAREVPTEVAQEAMDIALNRAYTQYRGALTDDEWSQLKNAAAGAAAFSILGIPAAVMRTSANPGGEDEDRDQDEVDDLQKGAKLALPPPEEMATLALEGAHLGQRRLPPPPPGPPGPPGPRTRTSDIIYEVDPEGNVTKIDAGKEIIALPQENVVPFALQPKAAPDLRTAIRRELNSDKEDTPDSATVFKDDGTAVQNSAQGVDSLDLLAQSVVKLPPEMRSTTDNGIVIANSTIQTGKKRRQKIAAQPQPEDKQVRVAPEVKNLLMARDDILADPKLRNTKGGELSKSGKKQVAAVEARIKRTTELLGAPNPIATHLDLKEDASKEIQKFNTDEINEAKQGNLSPGEKEFVAKLEEKEVTEGLTDEEEKTLEQLYLKRIARPKKQRNARLSAHQLRSLSEAPPFEVNTAIGSEEFLSEGVPEGVMRSRESTRTEGGRRRPATVKFSVEQVTAAVKELSANFPRKPTFVVTPNTGYFRDVPDRRHLVAEKYDTIGMFFQKEPDTVYIFSDRIQSTQQLARLLLHEMFHKGFYNYMNGAERRQFLEMVIARFGKEVTAKVENFHMTELAATINDPSPKNRNMLNEAMLQQAEEVLAEQAEKDPKSGFMDRIIAFFSRVLRRLMPTFKVTDAEIRSMIKDVGAWSRNNTQVTERNLRDVSQPFRSREFERAIGRNNTFTTETLPGLKEWGEVWGQKFLNGVLTPLQMANSTYVKKTLPSAGTYLEFVQQWWARKRNLTNTPVEIAEQWTKLGKRDAEKLAKVVVEISQESDAKNERLSEAEIKAVFVRNGLDPSTTAASKGARHVGSRNVFEIWRDMDQSFQQIVNDMEKGLQITVIRQAIREPEGTNPITNRKRAEDLAKNWRREASHRTFFDEVASSKDLKDLHLGGRLLEIERQMQALRNRNYFPRMRFGKYAITVRAKADVTVDGQDFKGPREGKSGEVVWFETHEGPAAQIQRRQELSKGMFGKDPHFEIKTDRLSDNEFVFLGMPPSLYEVLRGELGLTGEQEERLKEIYRKFSPGAAFLKHLIRRKDIAGFSSDAIRTYASYMMNAANHLARVEFHQDLGESLSNIRREASLPINATRAGEIREYFARHFQYLMNPGNDWARLRSLGFMWYLGFNVKSALVNLTQVPMVAYPYLAHHYGDKAAFGAIAKAYSDVAKMRRGGKVLDAETDADLARAIADGFVDESRATELAGLAEGNILERLMPQSTSSQIVNKFSHYGSFLFRHAEKFNRETVFLAARELAKSRGMKGEQVYRAAREAVQTTMFEYAKWNRPEFMRGKKSVFFLFWNYAQHLSYLAYGGEGSKVAMRVWLALLLAAGVEGLPFAQNFMDIFDFGATEVKDLMGSKDPRTDLRGDIRDLANTITDSPDMIMHGLSRYYGLGPMHFLSLFDVPVPNVDVSGSLGAGDIIPGLREAFAANEDPDAKIGKVLIDAFGPVVGMGYNLWRASVDDNPDTWKVWERAMPSAIQSVSKSFRRGSQGGETFRGGGKVIEFEPQNIQHRMENIAQALGFAPTRLNQRTELRYSQEQLRQYWTSRRAALMESYAYAQMAREPEAVDLATKKIREYNKVVPSKVLAIGQDALHQSVVQRYRRATLRENGVPSENSFRALYRRIEQRFPEGSAQVAGRSPSPAPGQSPPQY